LESVAKWKQKMAKDNRMGTLVEIIALAKEIPESHLEEALEKLSMVPWRQNAAFQTSIFMYVYSAVSNLGNTRQIIVIARATRRGNPCGRLECHVAALLAMTQSGVVCVFGIFMYTKLLTAE
jgi:hypothetical protein